MKNIVLFLTLAFWIPSISFAQTDLKVEAAVETFNNGEFDKGIKKMEKLLKKNSNDEYWSIVVQMYQMRYKMTQEAVMKQMVNDLLKGLEEGGNKETNNITIQTNTQLVVQQLMAYIDKCKEASLYSQSVDAAVGIRQYLVDYDPDTAIVDQAKEEYKTAEDFFAKRDYKSGLTHYLNAIKLQPNYYKATLYAGDCYWYMGKLDSAEYYFRQGVEMCPDLLEPRKYLTDAYIDYKKFDLAKETFFGAIYVYPDPVMFAKYALIMKESKMKKVDMHWIPRGCKVVTIYEQPEKVKSKAWKIYKSASEDMRPYCGEDGMITKKNKLTESKYLEVYAWEKMLNETEELPENLKFAKEMQEKGFLDCYVFISMFHYSCLSQYRHFVEHNKDRIKKYMEEYVTK